MSKSGRYSADRKKIEALSASKTVEVADCGTIFTLNEDAGLTTVTLPLIASAGNGWWCRFVLGSLSGGTNTDITIASNASDVDKVYGNVVNSMPLAAAPHISGSNFAGVDGVKFDTSACAIGDVVEFYTDASNWYVEGITSGSAAIIKHDA